MPHVGGSKALVSLALRCAQLSGRDVLQPADGAVRHGGVGGGGGGGDVAVLKSLAEAVKEVVNTGGLQGVL